MTKEDTKWMAKQIATNYATAERGDARVQRMVGDSDRLDRIAETAREAEHAKVLANILFELRASYERGESFELAIQGIASNC